MIRLRYRPDQLMLAIADDGTGDPVTLSRLLRIERNAVTDGRHRGLANMPAIRPSRMTWICLWDNAGAFAGASVAVAITGLSGNGGRSRSR